jgi:hypothetical protein
MFVEVGPASLVIQGEKDGRPFEFEREQLIKNVNSILGEIRDYLPVLKQKSYKIKNTKHMPDVPRKMVEAVKTIDEASLTPMAAVAGSVADAIKDFLKSEGLDLVLVNNGGDISIFNENGRRLKIDIGDIFSCRRSPHALSIEHLGDYGIATSGFGGRSFTLGLADTVTVIAASGALADAAATFICNCTDTESDQVMRQRASEIDPLTDIPDELVTIRVNQLNEHDIFNSVENGLIIANNMIKQSNIYDAIIRLQGHTVATITGVSPIKLEVHDGN